MLSFLCALLASPPVIARATVWKIDPAKSTVSFVVFRGARVGARGTFKNVTGNIIFDPNSIAFAKVDARIPIDTIETGIGARDADLIGPKYFNAGRFSTAVFTAQKLRVANAANDGKYVVTGLFKLHGVSRAIDLLMTKPTIISSANGRTRLVAAAATTIDQSDYGLNFDLLHPDGFVRINNKIDIKINVEAGPGSGRSQHH